MLDCPREQRLLRARRTARREGQRPFRRHRAALRFAQRPPELRPAPPLETPRRRSRRRLPGDRALDLCCGTGDIAFALARRGAETTGLDFSENARSRRRAPFEISQNSNLKFMQGDAQQLPFPDNSFDIVTVGYGLRNLTSWERGLDEMSRVARPGARLIVLDFGKPRERALAEPLFRAPEDLPCRSSAGCFAATRRLTPTFSNR
jgi:SAM-dependent methyltransferase